MLINEILNNWSGIPCGYAIEIPSLNGTEYKAWTIRTEHEFGVAIPVSESVEISENFAGAHLFSDDILLNNSEQRRALLLMTKNDKILIPFASLCVELITPGDNGEFRREVTENPVIWWMQWKELLGNRNVDDRVYDVIGELLVLKYLAECHRNVEWNGPDGATYDIECDGEFYEVKSTITRNKREITLSNHFQLDPPNGAKLHLILCQFESAHTGVSINQLVNDLVNIGYSMSGLNNKLESLGLEKGKSARNRQYIVHAMLQYEINDDFPAIRDTSFVGGTLPECISSITYTMSLDGLTANNLLQKK